MKRLLVISSIFLAAQSHAGPKLEPLQEQDIDYGCGCSFQLPSSSDAKPLTVLQWELGERANIRIDGVRRKLEVKELKPEAQPERPRKVGDKTVFQFQGGGLSATAACIVTEICPPERPACEVTLFKAKLTVRSEKA